MTAMKLRTPTYFSGKSKIKGLSGSVLKILAITFMLMDHASVVFNGGNLDIWRIIGRLAFPIFAYFIAEGAGRTKNIYKYMLRLGAFALVSEIPFDLALYNDGWFSLKHQNVYFTLLLGLIAIWSYQLLSTKKLGILSVLPAGVLSVAADFLETDYGGKGVLFIYALYFVIRLKPVTKGILFVVCCLGLCIYPYQGMIYFNDSEIFAILALIPLMLYNGQKGFKMNKYFFYAFYPVHLLILWLMGAVFSC